MCPHLHCIDQPCHPKTGENPAGGCKRGYTSLNCSIGMLCQYIVSTQVLSVTSNKLADFYPITNILPVPRGEACIKHASL
jgi:hypothetical protein